MPIGPVYGAAMKENLARWAALSEIYLCMLSAAIAMQSICAEMVKQFSRIYSIIKAFPSSMNISLVPVN